MKNKFKYHRAC